MSFRLNELAQPLMALLLLVAIVIASFLVIAPFLVATLWAIIVVSATWDQFAWLSARLGGRDGLAASLLVGLLMLFIMVPLVLASSCWVLLSVSPKSVPQLLRAWLVSRKLPATFVVQ